MQQSHSSRAGRKVGNCLFNLTDINDIIYILALSKQSCELTNNSAFEHDVLAKGVLYYWNSSCLIPNMLPWTPRLDGKGRCRLMLGYVLSLMYQFCLFYDGRLCFQLWMFVIWRGVQICKSLNLCTIMQYVKRNITETAKKKKKYGVGVRYFKWCFSTKMPGGNDII